LTETDEKEKVLRRALNLIFDRDGPTSTKRRRLTHGQVMDIRLDAMDGTMSQRQLAAKHNVSQACISLILNHARHKIARD
jgi:hypothetical protein